MSTSLSSNTLRDRSMSSNVEDWPIFSHSQLQTWDRCELAWKLSYKDKWTRKVQPVYLSKGSNLHKMQQIFYNGKKDHLPVGMILDQINQFSDELARTAIENGDTAALTGISDVLRCAHIYINQFAPKNDAGHSILATEYHFTVPFTTGQGYNFVLQGYGDLLTELNGKLHLWDHKSGESKFWSLVEVEMDSQLPTYSMALRELGMSVHCNTINMFNTYNYKKPENVTVEQLFKRETAFRTDRQLDSIRDELFLLVDDLIDNNDFVRRSLRRDCSRCQFHDPCMMSMKGIDPVPFLQDRFVKKEEVEVELKLTPRNLMETK